jgi:hypothetical protein
MIYMINKRLLRGELASHGYSVGKMAEEIGINRATFSKKMNGAKNSYFDTNHIEQMCQLLKITDGNKIIAIFLGSIDSGIGKELEKDKKIKYSFDQYEKLSKQIRELLSNNTYDESHQVLMRTLVDIEVERKGRLL